MPRELKQSTEIAEATRVFWRRVLIAIGFVTALKVLFAVAAIR